MNMRKEINYMKMAVMNTAGAEQEVCMSILRKLENLRKVRKIRIALLKAITWIAGILFILSILTFDSADTSISAIIMLASGSWLALMAYANR